MKLEKPTLRCLNQPISCVHWVRPATLHANNYNPNKVFPPELQLIKISLLKSGWTQPLVALDSGEIVDGFHRWTLASKDSEIFALTDGLVPVVFVECRDDAEQMMTTIRHNRARGQHGILKMGEIVRRMVDAGRRKEQVMELLKMEEEEFDRLAETKGAPARVGKDSFGRGWVPDTPEAAKAVQLPAQPARNGAQEASGRPARPTRPTTGKRRSTRR